MAGERGGPGPHSGALAPRCAASRSVPGSVTTATLVVWTVVWEGGQQQRNKV